VDNLIVSRNDRAPYAIVSVGGFLGIGTKLVAVPMAELKLAPDISLLPGAAKEVLMALPEFEYAISPRAIAMVKEAQE
jgi:hypothetical protein